MFKDIPIVYIIGPVILIAAFVFVYFRRKPYRNELHKALTLLKVSIIALGAFSFILFFALPFTSVLGTFHYLTITADISNQERLLDYMQEYSAAIKRTTEALWWFLFVFIFWFLNALFSFVQALQKQLNV